jgi:hypothetical protein
MASDIPALISELITARWDDPTAALHGFYCPSDPNREFSFDFTSAEGQPANLKCGIIAFPYLEVMRQYVDRSDIPGASREIMTKAMYSIRERLELLIRALQHLGESQAAVEQTMGLLGVTINVHRDFKMHIDSVTTYLRTTADLISVSVPYLLTDPADSPYEWRLRLLLKSSRSDDGRYPGIFDGCDIEWFIKLAGNEGLRAASEPKALGLRTYREHHGAVQWVMGHGVGDGEDRVETVTGSLSTGPKNYSTDLVSDLRSVCCGLFRFMDFLARKAGRTYPALDLRRIDLTYMAFIVAPVQTDFLKSMLPHAEHPADDAPVSVAHSSPA